MADTVGAIYVDIQARLDRLERDLRRAESSVAESAQKMQKAGGALTFGLSLAGGIAAASSSFRLLTAAVQASRGDWQAVEQAVRGLPLGLGAAVGAAIDFHKALTGADDALARQQTRMESIVNSMKTLKSLQEQNVSMQERLADLDLDAEQRAIAKMKREGEAERAAVARTAIEAVREVRNRPLIQYDTDRERMDYWAKRQAEIDKINEQADSAIYASMDREARILKQFDAARAAEEERRRQDRVTAIEQEGRDESDRLMQTWARRNQLEATAQAEQEEQERRQEVEQQQRAERLKSLDNDIRAKGMEAQGRTLDARLERIKQSYDAEIRMAQGHAAEVTRLEQLKGLDLAAARRQDEALNFQARESRMGALQYESRYMSFGGGASGVGQRGMKVDGVAEIVKNTKATVAALKARQPAAVTGR